MKFQIKENTTSGRIGGFESNKENILGFETPCLFPVTSLMTGTTARGGGVWRYILHADYQHGFMRKNIPIISETLHFLDYSITGHQLEKWRETKLRNRYYKEMGVDYHGAIFLDSGGFRLMWRDGLDLTDFGIDLSLDKEAESILKLQLDLGANLVASLDYPLPPGLSIDEQIQRMGRSQVNAINVANILRNQENPPFLYMAVHGQTPELISEYVKKLFKRIEENQLDNLDFGIAIGSLVPMRSAGQLDKIIRLVWATIQAIPERYRQQVPVHTFGLSGAIVPFLVHCGVDTFDSSTYIQHAKSFRYIDHETLHARRILDIRRDEFTCNCYVCRGINLVELQDALVTVSHNKPLATGHYKSKYYADIALHNLIADTKIIDKTILAIKSNYLADYLIEVSNQFPQIQPALATLSHIDPKIRNKVDRFVINFSASVKINKPVKLITFKHTSDDFNINSNGYYPEIHSIMLILPCSAEKPYSTSTSHRFIQSNLSKSIPNWTQFIHKVSLSGLYGPVPEEKETEEAVNTYDFLLKPENKSQIKLCVDRLVEYLNRHQKQYHSFVAYGTTKAYRIVFEQAAKQFPELKVLPNPIKKRKSSEFYSTTNINALTGFLKNLIED